MVYLTPQDYDYAVACRRELHRHPETLFDLPRTVAFVREKLDELEIAWSEAGPSSVTAWLGPKDAGTAIGLRADLDALPVQEQTGLEYASETPGKMHACGHDAHTAILLTVARVLKRHEAELKVRVKLLFEPSEEGEISGAKSMVEHGAADDIDLVLATHCDNDVPVGCIGVRAGDYMAACNPITLTFHGKSAHATLPEQGVDAIAMAWEAYGALKAIAAAEAGADTVYIFGMNYFHGGTAHNVISDRCELKISFRYYDRDFAARVEEKCLAKCREIASRYGGTVEANWYCSAPPVYNDPKLTERFRDAVEQTLPGRLVELALRKSTEDFSWFLQKKPGLLFRFGTRNEQTGCTTLAHCSDFRIDERGMEYAAEAFLAFVLRWQA